MSITVTNVEIDNTYEITGTFVDKNGDPVAASDTKFRVYSSDYMTEMITPIIMTEGATLGTYVAYLYTGLLTAGKYIFRIEGTVATKIIGDNEYVKIMYVEPE